MNILIATSEAVPFVKTGGLADVTGSLLKEFEKTAGAEVHLMLPLYRGVSAKFRPVDTGKTLSIHLGDRVYEGRVRAYGPSVYFIECNEFFDRPEPYGTPQGDYADNASRFAFFDRAVLEACMALGLKPDVIHCNDWQTGLIPLYLRTLYDNEFFKGTATVMTVHNLGYQGLFDASDFGLTGLGTEWFNPEGVEFYGKVNFLKAGLIAGDILTTVSPTYAREILSPEFGYGLDGLLRKRADDLHGVINGIDTEEWDPRHDRHIHSTYGPSGLAGKAKCKRMLMEECSLRGGRDVPVAAFVGRLSAQKGLDILLDCADDIISLGLGLIVLGKGDEYLQEKVMKAAERHRGTAFVKIGYDEAFAHRIYAGSDIFLMPSRYEPCGLGQLIAMRYGTLPVARKTGGLADTIVDYNPLTGSGTGFLFSDYSVSAFCDAVKRALCAYADRRRWRAMVARAMLLDFSWRNSAKQYLELYARAVEMKRRGS